MADILLHPSMHFDDPRTGATAHDKMKRLRQDDGLIVEVDRGFLCIMKKLPRFHPLRLGTFNKE